MTLKLAKQSKWIEKDKRKHHSHCNQRKKLCCPLQRTSPLHDKWVSLVDLGVEKTTTNKVFVVKRQNQSLKNSYNGYFIKHEKYKDVCSNSSGVMSYKTEIVSIMRHATSVRIEVQVLIFLLLTQTQKKGIWMRIRENRGETKEEKTHKKYQNSNGFLQSKKKNMKILEHKVEQL